MPTRASLNRPFPGSAAISWHLPNGRSRRAERIEARLRSLARRLGGALRGAVRRPAPARRQDQSLADAVCQLKSPLTAIRSSAEILRDNPDMAPAERARFLRMLLVEEQRLEALLSALLSSGPGQLADR